MSCPGCPCPGGCPGHAVYCGWAAEVPVDEVKLRHIRAKAGCGDTPSLDFAAAAPDPRPRGLARELVVCRYRESLEWLDGVSADFFVSLLDKSDEPFAVSRQVRRRRLPNVGREAHSMLSHIVGHYDSLADWTCFCQGDALVHAPDFLARLAVDYGDLCSLTETYLPTHPPECIRAQDRVEWFAGFQVRYGNARLRAPGWERPFGNPAAWDLVFACVRPDPHWFGYAAQYAVPRRRITGRPRAFWAWLLRESERSPWQLDEWTDPPLTPWQLEALWLYLFSDPAEYPHRADVLIAGDGPPTVAESLAMVRDMKACPFHSRDAGCGCSGGRCGLRGGAIVSHRDCFECLRKYP